MASTYNDLKIQLMATGENSTTWGDITNVNWDAIAEAVTGSVDVTFASGAVTLSLTDTNASQSARNLRLNLIGTSGGAQNLIVPTIEKLYLINNGVADTITVKTTAGTGIAVPAGKTMWVFADGTNVVNAVTHLSSLTLGTVLGTPSGGTGLTSFNANGAVYATSSSALSTGTLPVNGGGTGQTSYTDGQLLIGNTTGNTLAKGTLTAGSGISITNGGGSITIATTGGAGTVTSVNGSGGTTGLTLTGGPITSSGTLTLGGTLIAANGGTGITSVGTSGNVLTSNGTAWVSSAPAASGVTQAKATGIAFVFGS